MALKKLELEDFKKTFEAPMNRAENPRDFIKPGMQEAVTEIIEEESLPTELNKIRIHQVYQHPEKAYYHVLFHYGIDQEYLVLVAQTVDDSLLGYHILDAREADKEESDQKE